MVLAVSNGLLLTCTTRDTDGGCCIRHDCYYICNPLTKEWAVLPKPPRIGIWVCLGFIVEPCDGSFQVVRIDNYKGSSKSLAFEIFSSKTCQWKEKSVSFDLNVNLMKSICNAVPCKKILHWMDDKRILTYDSSQSGSENDETIQCHLIDLPSDRVIHDKRQLGMIGVCHDNLHYFQVAKHHEGIKNLSIWELRKYNNGGEGEWFLLHRIRYSEVNPSPLPYVQAIALHPLNSDLVYVHCLLSTEGIICLNLRTRDVENTIPLEADIYWWTVFAFVLPTWPTPVPRISSAPV